MNGQPATAQNLGSAGEPVALVLSRQVKPGHEQAFEQVLSRLAGAVRGQPGHLDVTVLLPARGGPPIYTIVSHFRTRADADAWLGSPQRARLVAEAGLHAAGELQTRYVSGLEGWLAAPGAPVLVPPARWKTALVAAPGSCRCRRRSATCSPRGWPRCRPMAGYRTGQPGKAGATAALRPHCGPLVRLTRGASPARSAHHLPTRASRPATPA